MALIQCPECGKTVSSLAVSCPHCGCPIAQEQEEMPAIETIISRDNPTVMGKFLNCNIYIDNQLIGALDSGYCLKTTLHPGRHSVVAETLPCNNLPLLPNTIRFAMPQKHGEEFAVDKDAKKIYIDVRFQGNYYGTAGRLIIDNIETVKNG